MRVDEIVEGQEFHGVLGELIVDPETNRRRVRTLPDQVVPAGLFIECSKTIRSRSKLHTVFKFNVGVGDYAAVLVQRLSATPCFPWWAGLESNQQLRDSESR